MKAVLKLVLTYFTGTPLLAVTLLLGVLAVVGGSCIVSVLAAVARRARARHRASRSVWRRSYSCYPSPAS